MPDRAISSPRKKAQRAKHTSDPISPAPGTLLSTALLSGSLQLYLNFIVAQGTRLPRHPKIKEITNSTRNITNRSFAMPADAAAIPPNPKIAATSAMIRNITAQPNISSPPPRLNRICRLTRASLHAVFTFSTLDLPCGNEEDELLGIASFSLVATVLSLRLPNQKRGPFHRDFNFAARFSIVPLLARPRFAIKMHRTRWQRNFELAKFARR